MKKYLLFIVAVLAGVCAYGQSEVDALRYSQTDLSGTARGQAMGGAFGALGGDATGVSINPAGIAVYNKSELVLNAGLTFNNVKGIFGNSTATAKKTTPSIDNISYAGAYDLDGGSRLNFGFNFSRIKSYDRKYSVNAKGLGTSLSDYIAQTTNDYKGGKGVAYSEWDRISDNNLNPYYNIDCPWLTILGWDGYLIDKNDATPANNDYISAFSGKPNAKLNVYERGNIGSYDFTLGYTNGDIFYFGASLSLTSLSYTLSNADYSEEFSNYDGFTLRNYLNTEGAGAQVKLGIIAKPIDEIRFGLSYHSPVWYSMTDYYCAEVQPYGVKGTATPEEAFRYSFRTPGLWTFSAAAVIAQKAIVSVDYELKDYRSMRLYDSEWYPFETDNDFIKSDFRWTSSVRSGLEYRFTPQFSGRAGYAWKQAPYTAEIVSAETPVVTAGTVTHYTIDGDVHYITGGLGYKFTPQIYLDLAYVYRTQKDDLYFWAPIYDSNGDLAVASTPTKLKTNSSKVLLTLGYKF